MSPCDRRDFVRLGTAALAAALTQGCASLMTRRVPVADGRVRLDLRQYPELTEPGGTLRLLPDGWADPLYVLSLTPGRFVALSPICTHLGCTVEMSGQRLICPCHGSTYDREGKVLQGPAERPLRQFPSRVMPDGLLVIDVEGSSR
jgi:Rieske Fe-S protein